MSGGGATDFVLARMVLNQRDASVGGGSNAEADGKLLEDVAAPTRALTLVELNDLTKFIEKAHEWGDRIPTGVFLENRSQSSFAERITSRVPSYRTASPAHRTIADENGRPTTDLSEIFAEVAMT